MSDIISTTYQKKQIDYNCWNLLNKLASKSSVPEKCYTLGEADKILIRIAEELQSYYSESSHTSSSSSFSESSYSYSSSFSTTSISSSSSSDDEGEEFYLPGLASSAVLTRGGLNERALNSEVIAGILERKREILSKF